MPGLSENLLLFAAVATALLEARTFVLASEKGKGRFVHYAVYLGLTLKIDRIAGRLTIEAPSPALYALYFLAASVGLRFAFGLLVVRMRWFSAAFTSLTICLLRAYLGVLGPTALYLAAMACHDAFGGVPAFLLSGKLRVFAQLLLYLWLLRLVFKKWWPRKGRNEAYLAFALLPLLAPVLYLLRQTAAPVAGAVSAWISTSGAAPQSAMSFGEFLALLLPCSALLLLFWIANRRLNRLIARERDEKRRAEAENESRRQADRDRFERHRSQRSETGDRLLAAIAQMRRGDEAAALATLRTVAANWETAEFPVRSGNAVADILLAEKLFHAEHSGIAVSHDFSVEDWSGVDDADVVTILSSLLDGAVAEALEGGAAEPFVRVEIARENGALLIAVANRRSGNGEPEEARLARARAAVVKYGGSLTIETTATPAAARTVSVSLVPRLSAHDAETPQPPATQAQAAWPESAP